MVKAGFLVLIVGISGVVSVTARGETVLGQIDLAKEKVGEAPATAALGPGETARQFAYINVKGGNTLTVAEGLGNLKGPVLKFVKQDDVNGAPAATLAIDPVRAGKVRITWQAIIQEYNKGSRSQTAEPLLTVNLIGKDGLFIFSLEYLVMEGSGGGQFSIPDFKPRLDRWDFKDFNTFVLDVDFDAQTSTLTIDGKLAGEKIKFANAGPLRFVQFRDGTGLGAVDGKFVGAVSNIKVVRDPDAKAGGKENK